MIKQAAAMVFNPALYKVPIMWDVKNPSMKLIREASFIAERLDDGTSRVYKDRRGVHGVVFKSEAELETAVAAFFV